MLRNCRLRLNGLRQLHHSHFFSSEATIELYIRSSTLVHTYVLNVGRLDDGRDDTVLVCMRHGLDLKHVDGHDAG